MGTATFSTTDGRSIVHLRRRFVPPPERFVPLKEHVVTEGERLDTIAASEIGDPEAFWRIADANAAMRPEVLTETVGRRLRVTLPEGIAAVPMSGSQITSPAAALSVAAPQGIPGAPGA